MSAPLIELRNVSKSFGNTYALRDIDFRVDRGEVVSLIGDNGAGKTTLVRTIAGVHKPDTGELLLRGEPVEHWTPARARDMGIETVHQGRALAEQQTITRNIFLGRERTNRFGFLKLREQREEAERLMREIGFTSKVFSPDSVVGLLSGGERQGVAIARALYFKADLIVLDEPTTALSLSESNEVLDFVRRAKADGTSSIFISHTIAHAHDVADRLVILDRGRVVADVPKAGVSLEALIEGLQDLARTGDVTSIETATGKGTSTRPSRR
jgi:simple sugar transport system ATP-binding protein